mmetsp:Transcript_25898/g.59851  ORF Transcript_25898/g.59851 Transcript_25898/m.59851 type:complete len:166 (+) Transcript_25898:97-594(+)
MLAHYCTIAGAMYVLPSWLARAGFLASAIGVAGMLHVQITLSHFASDTHQGVAYDENERSWWHMQLAGTCDVDCSPAMDWFHGGLQYQSIHHLFPRLPRYRLRAVSKEVAEVAHKASITYHHKSFAALNREVIATLRKTAELCAASPLANGPGAPMLWDSLHARG